MELFDIDLHKVFSYKYIFNPSVARIENGIYKLVCRLQNHEEEGFLGICYLDQNYTPISDGIVIHSSPLHDLPVMLEDPRIVCDGKNIFIGYVEASPSFFYLIYTVFAKLNGNRIENPVVIKYKSNEKAWKALSFRPRNSNKKVLPMKDWLIEKNWQFFIQDGRYYCVYESRQRHNVIEFDPDKGNVLNTFNTYYDLPWKYGRISGGASPVLFSDNHYYSFFHSWTTWDTAQDKKDWRQRKYHIGVYVFERTPPFGIKRISKIPIFSGDDDDKLAPSGHSVVFPGSAIYDGERDEWLIALGWNDHSCKFLKVKHSEVVANLVPVMSISFWKTVRIKVNSYLKTPVDKVLKRITFFIRRQFSGMQLNF